MLERKILHLSLMERNHELRIKFPFFWTLNRKFLSFRVECL